MSNAVSGRTYTHRLTRTCVPLAALAVLAALPAAAPAGDPDSGPIANGARRCHLTLREQRHLGTTYVFSLRVRHTSCRNGKRVVRAYHRCRHRSGGRDGRCRRRVYGYRCGESRFNKSRFSYDARVRCRKGGRRVNHTYTQNL